MAYHFDITLSIQQEVFRFQVSEDNAHRVEVIKGLTDTTSAKSGCWLIKITPGGYKKNQQINDTRYSVNT